MTRSHLTSLRPVQPNGIPRRYVTDAFFGVNDFYPFNRVELQEAEPELF